MINPFAERKKVWVHWGNHHHLRITRIFKCLCLLGLKHKRSLDQLSELQNVVAVIQKKLFEDAEEVLKLVTAKHISATSSLTYYEVEEALFKQMTSVAKGMTNASTLRFLAARSIVPQTVTAVRFFGISVLDLTAGIVEAQLNNIELYIRGIRAADALHVASAIQFDAEVIISVNEDVLKLDGVILNSSGIPIKFCDS
ncbi:PIN domain-containing protein [Sphaerospermopsis sp. LEGE 08334]|uniref:PIN domain-containing protein n=1 Tax=Sphaerospermopsis sp. LEGE 08334 TaxID=1828651 RepID=UPI00187F8A3E|nr:PIN domain-containing protein [Sphaerospermopsis sp. LEGE 08334]MBE9058198.1 PIN domain-containing protein [Sphaerospermopsis sp. LEGE 08334]